jgi:ZIP family zinc transporter
MEALLWGLLASSSLLLGGIVVLLRPPSLRTIALVMAFGAGVLISAVAYDLVAEAFERSDGATLFTGLAAGAVAFYIGDLLIDRAGGEHRKTSTGMQASGSGAAIAFGTILDGIPEAVVLGTTVVTGLSWTFLIAVFLSNLPEAMSATAGLYRAGTKASSILFLWAGTTAVSGIAALVGYLALGEMAQTPGAFIQAFAAGALLTMLADTMIPEAFQLGGPAAGLITVLGFSVAFALSTMGAA